MLGGQYSGSSREAREFYRSHVQIENLVSVTSGCPNVARVMTHHGFFDHTNPTT